MPRGTNALHKLGLVIYCLGGLRRYGKMISQILVMNPLDPSVLRVQVPTFLVISGGSDVFSAKWLVSINFLIPRKIFGGISMKHPNNVTICPGIQGLKPNNYSHKIQSWVFVPPAMCKVPAASQLLSFDSGEFSGS